MTMKRPSVSTATDPKGTPALPDEQVPEEEWLGQEDYEGQLAVDVYQTPETIVIRSAIAGVEPDDLDIAVNRDVVTIRGKRKQSETIEDHDYLFQECYWGNFSRSIILPTDVQADAVTAEMKNGILTITLPVARENGVRVIPVTVEKL